ncbi:MAG: histidinol-phosphate transaminase [Halofilum sp. (in: g-proteobacteria)]
MTFDPAELAVPGVRGLAPYEPGKPIEEVAREYGLDADEVIKLASNENPRGPSPRAIDAAREAAAEVHRYPDGAGTSLREHLAARHCVEPTAITLGNGSNDVLDLVARTFLGPGRNAVFSRHAFAVYPIATRLAGAAAHVAAAHPADDPKAPYGHDLEAMAEQVDADTRVVFVANPNNPTGTWIDRAALERFLGRVPEHVIVVLDEAYSEYVDEPEFPDGVGWLRQYPNLIVTRTFSKIYGLSGLRCGYGISSPAIADLLNRARHPFNVNSIALAAAEASLEDNAFVTESARINAAGRVQLDNGFRELGLDPIPSVANFIAVDVGGPGEAMHEALMARGVITRPIGAYEMPNHLRVTVGTSAENDRALAAFKAVLQQEPGR